MEFKVEEIVEMHQGSIYWAQDMWRKGVDQYNEFTPNTKIAVNSWLEEAGIDLDIFQYCVPEEYHGVSIYVETNVIFRELQEMFDELYEETELMAGVEDFIFMVGEATLTLQRVDKNINAMKMLGANIDTTEVLNAITKEMFQS